MSGALKLEFAPLARPPRAFSSCSARRAEIRVGRAATRSSRPATWSPRAAAADRFKGKNGSALDIVAPPGSRRARLVVVGVGQGPLTSRPEDFVKLGGAAMGRIPAAAGEATILADLPGGSLKPERVADLALGVQLRAYTFDRYKTKRKDDGGAAGTGQGHDRGRRRRGGREGVRAAPRGWRTAS